MLERSTLLMAAYACMAGSGLCCTLVLRRMFALGARRHAIAGVLTLGVWAFVWAWFQFGRAIKPGLLLIWTLLVLGAAAVVAAMRTG